jgi:transporter family-2 protein
MTEQSPPRLLDFIGAFATGGLLTLMVWFNGTLAITGSLLFASWVPHVTGSILAIVVLMILRPKIAKPTAKIPWWAYLGGISGAVTVMLTSATMNSALAISGTIALGLAGQMIFSLIADKWGMMGLPQRDPTGRDVIALALIMAGSIVLIFFGGA